MLNQEGTHHSNELSWKENTGKCSGHVSQEHLTKGGLKLRWETPFESLLAQRAGDCTFLTLGFIRVGENKRVLLKVETLLHKRIE